MAGWLVGRFPDRFDRYFEPFLGGASVLLELRPARGVVGDRNDWLLDAYEAVRDDHKRVAEILDGLPNTREAFERIRAIRPEGLGFHRRAAHLIYLNKTCFRGLFRVNQSGAFNVPYGAYDRRYYDPENLEAVAARLQGVEIRRGDFEATLADASANDFIYLDPPYHKLGGFSDFNRYTQSQFRESDHARLADLCRDLDARGVRWAVSNSDTPLVRELFEGFRIANVAARREINLNSRGRDVNELFITNYEVKEK